MYKNRLFSKPGQQFVLHVITSTGKDPGQKLPIPFCPTQGLVLVWVPPSHDLVHLLKGPQGPHAPSASSAIE